MRKTLAITALLLALSGNAWSAPGESHNALDNMETIDSRFDFESEDFDASLIIADIDDGFGDVYASKAEDVIEFAKRYLGCPYSYGSKGPRAFDCSGFTSFVYSNFDIKLSPSSSTQSTQGERITRGEIRPGDLLFFKGRRSSGVGHVAIAVDVDDNGEVTFIHAATSRGIRIDHLNSDPYYKSRYLYARRVLE